MKQTSTNTKHHRVSAVVVTYNRLALLKESIAALEAQTTPIQTLYVVDNASSDDTQEWMEKKVVQQSPLTIAYLRMDQNLGGAAGFEYGSWCW